jgi:CheY-like chemotaxis protein
MLMDNQMPRLWGIQVIKMLRKFIEEENKTRAVQVKEPMLVIVASYVSQNLKNFLRVENVKHPAHEKPLQKEEMSDLLR